MPDLPTIPIGALADVPTALLESVKRGLHNAITRGDYTSADLEGLLAVEAVLAHRAIQESGDDGARRFAHYFHVRNRRLFAGEA